jgi:integrase
MRINLPGIAKVKAKGRTYWYAWRGGPRLVGQPGSPEFLTSYEAAHRARRNPSPNLLRSIVAGYKGSRDFTKLRDRTKVDYLRSIGRIEAEFGDLPLAALEDPRITREFLNWRDAMASTPRTADAHWTVLMLILSWARQGGLTTYRPPERVARLYHGDRSEMVWTEADVAAFLAKAPETLRRALLLALYTGQRQGDLLALTWTAYDGQWIRLRQSKTGVRVAIPVHTRLRAALDGLPRVSTHILTNAHHRPWRQDAPSGLRPI